jgi:Ubiquitin-activating enzyme E1 FCCH domain
MADPTPPTINIVVGATGPIPTPPSVIRSNLLTYLQAANPGYTDLPGALIEDILSTDIAAISVCDSAAIDLINSLSPVVANSSILVKLGQVYGVPQSVDTNTSVFCVFSGPAGFVVPQGFVVTDGTYQYTVQDGGIIATGGQSPPLFCVATVIGSWPILPNTVTQVVTSVPHPPGPITVTNPNTGTPSAGVQTEADYRAQVLQAGLASAQGMGRFLKTLLGNVSGVQPRLVSVKQVSGGGWEVIVGGGDPYEVANAIWTALFDVSLLVGSTIHITGITNANPGVVTTDLNHGLITGQTGVAIAGVVGMTGVNGGPYTVTVLSENTFSFGVNTTSSGTYVSGGSVTPNNRNITVNIQDYPDTYTIPYVNPPQQVVQVQLTWNTSSPNFVNPTGMAQLGGPAIQSYLNSIPVGSPINLFEMQEVFQLAVSPILPVQYLTRMVFTVSINGVSSPPETGTGIIEGDPESYFLCNASDIIITQG